MKTKLLLTSYFIICLFVNVNAQWQLSGLSNQDCRDIATDGSKIYAISLGKVSLSTDTGQTWNSASTGLPVEDALSVYCVGSTIYAGVLQNGVYKSTNFGTSWSPSHSGITADTIIDLASFGTNLLAGTAGRGVYSSANGSTWTAFNNCLANFTITSFIDTLGVVGTSGGGIYIQNLNCWDSINTGLTNRNVNALAGHSVTDLYAGTSGGVFHYDNSATWTAMNNNLTNLDVRAIAVSGANVFAGTNGGGIFYSADGGADWTQINTGLTTVSAKKIRCISILDNEVYVGTEFGSGGGVYKQSLSSIVASVNSIRQNNLFSVYPNPASDLLNVKIGKIKTDDVAVFELYDVTGRKAESVSISGKSNFSLSVKNISDGIYQCRIVTRDEIYNGSKILVHH